MVRWNMFIFKIFYELVLALRLLLLQGIGTICHHQCFPIAVACTSKTISVAGRGGLEGCEMLRIPHSLHNRLTDGGKVVSPTHQPRSTLQNYYFSAFGTHFC
jgi:hypothetical protein